MDQPLVEHGKDLVHKLIQALDVNNFDNGVFHGQITTNMSFRCALLVLASSNLLLPRFKDRYLLCMDMMWTQLEIYEQRGMGNSSEAGVVYRRLLHVLKEAFPCDRKFQTVEEISAQIQRAMTKMGSL